MGEGAIPLSEVRAYVEMFGHVGCDEISEFVTLIRASDDAYLEARAKT